MINYIYILFSFLLGFTISFFYERKFNMKFIIMSLLISLILIILFFYLGNNKKENFDNYYYDKLHDLQNKYNNSYNTEETQDTEDTEDTEDNIENRTLPEHNFNIHKEPRFEQDDTQNLTENNNTEEEETLNQSTNNNSNTEEEETKYFPKPHTNSLSMMYDKMPLNINISYNSQNSTNNLDNNKVVANGIENGSNKNGNGKMPKKKCNKNKGTYNYSDSRVYNNSDWIYGDYAWTNEPDYYIPGDDCDEDKPHPKNTINSCPTVNISQPLNEMVSARNYRKFNNENVCPLMINTPWSEYKSGDSEPEPYNL